MASKPSSSSHPTNPQSPQPAPPPTTATTSTSTSTSTALTSAPLPQNAPHLLLCEALGFSPQLLLDDIINIANNAVQDGVNGMEEFLQKWADERISSSAEAEAEATTHEVEQGLVAFQTLLEHHTDIAFDFFEAWSLRNIFMIPPDLPIVLPHMRGLDLTITEEQEQRAVEEVEELRRVLDGHRKLNRVLTRALRTSKRQRKAAESRLSHLSALLVPPPPPSSSSSPPSTTTTTTTTTNTSTNTPSSVLQTLSALPPKLLQLHATLSSLPPTSTLPAPHYSASSTTGASGSGSNALPSLLVEPGKRVWETSQSGYVNWALGRLLARAQRPGSGPGHAPPSSSQNSGEDSGGAGEAGLGVGLGGGGSGTSTGVIDRLDRFAGEVGSGEDIRGALEVVEGVRRELDDALLRAAGRSQGRSQERRGGGEEGEDRMEE